MKIAAVSIVQVTLQPYWTIVMFFSSLLADKYATSYTHFQGM